MQARYIINQRPLIGRESEDHGIYKRKNSLAPIAGTLKVNLLHALEDFLDAYPYSPAEVAMVEGVSNSIDVNATDIAILEPLLQVIGISKAHHRKIQIAYNELQTMIPHLLIGRMVDKYQKLWRRCILTASAFRMGITLR